MRPPVVDPGEWQCQWCRFVHIGAWTPWCPGCGRIDFLSVVVEPAALRAARAVQRERAS